MDTKTFKPLFQLFIFFILFCPCLNGPAQSPLLPSQPFMIMWAIPNKNCLGRPNPAAFGMEWEGRVAEFYEDSLGLYPYFSEAGQPVNGGLPQHTSLERHLQKVEGDLAVTLPQGVAPGLGVVRWEEWQPQWSRNRGKQRRFLEASRALLRGFFPDWNAEEVEKWAQVDFEAAAQSILVETLRELKRLRPQILWGVAPYPSCYNTDPTQKPLTNYTGQCPTAEMALNNELIWLWKQSNALYPILTLEKLSDVTKGAWLYTSNQIQEALRLAALAGSNFDLPVFPLVKSMYTSSTTFLTEADLVNTVGQSAAMGASGAIIWERFLFTKTQRSCSELGSYVRQVLGPYAVNVTTATRLCSKSLCQGRGRCVRKKPEDPVYLHLPHPHFLLVRQGAEGIWAMGKLPPGYLEVWRRDFRCQWFEALEGTTADQQSQTTIKPTSDMPTERTVVRTSVQTLGTAGQTQRTRSQSERAATVAAMMPDEQKIIISSHSVNYTPGLLFCVLLFISLTNSNI